jgi:phage-related protein
MPRTEISFYQNGPDDVPVLNWLKALKKRDRRSYAKCAERIQRLAELGHELRRPHADFLERGIYELRARNGRVNYRILYFFHGQHVALLAHAFTKEGKVAPGDIDLAVERKAALEADPVRHTYEKEV